MASSSSTCMVNSPIRFMALSSSACTGSPLRCLSEASIPPSDHELAKVCKRLSEGEAWPSVFPGVASINIAAEPDGPTISLRLTKNEGIPVKLLKEGEKGPERLLLSVV